MEVLTAADRSSSISVQPQAELQEPLPQPIDNVVHAELAGDDVVNAEPLGRNINSGGHDSWQLLFKHLTKEVFCKHAGRMKTLVSDASGLALPGEVVGIMGLSGSGKTTLLRLLSGRDNSSYQGHIFVNTSPMNCMLQHRIAFVPQYENFLPSETLSAREQLTFVARCRTGDNISEEALQDTVRTVLLQLNILHRADVSLRHLSGGERKRVSIGCELITNPRILLVDEATSNLDSASVTSFVSLVRDIAVTNSIPVVMTIHQPNSATFFSFDRVMLLFRSSIIFSGSPSECQGYFQQLYTGQVRATDHLSSIMLNQEPNRNFAEQIIDFLFRCQAVIVSDEGNNVEIGDGQNVVADSNNELADRWKQIGEWKTVADINNVLGLDSSNEIIGPKYVSADCLEVCPTVIHTYLLKFVGSLDILISADGECRAPSSMSKQLVAVATRSFRASHAAECSRSNMYHTLLMSVLVGMCWFQMKMEESRVSDFTSFLTFILCYYFFSGMKSGILLYLPERSLYRTERRSGTYRTISFVWGRWLSLLPSRMAVPTLFVICGYLLAIRNPQPVTLVQLVAVAILANVTGESLGWLITVIFDSEDAATSNGIMIGLLSFILGGFVQLIPPWLLFLSKMSAYRYLYDAGVLVLFGSFETVPCDAQGMILTPCLRHQTIPMSLVIEDILGVEGGSVGGCLLILLAYNVVLLTLTCLVLFFVDNKRPNDGF
jgi:ABC-type multidrug transport system ATPase subunit